MGGLLDKLMSLIGADAMTGAVTKGGTAPKTSPRQASGVKSYPVSLVGEQHYQAAVAACRVGDPVQVRHEPDNPFDDQALAVADGRGRTLGYVPRDCFLRDAIHDEGKGCRAAIGFVGAGEKGFTHVSIDVELCAGPIGERKFEAR